MSERLSALASELTRVTVTTFRKGKQQPIHHDQITVKCSTRLRVLKKHLKAKGLKGSLYIDGECQEKEKGKCSGNNVVQLNSESRVELHVTTFPRARSQYEVCVTYKKDTMKFMCAQDTTLAELKYLIQDYLHIPASELAFQGTFSPQAKAVETGRLVVIPCPKAIRNKIISSIPEEIMTREGALWAAKEICVWQTLAKKGLSLDKADIHAIENNNKYDTKEQRFQALITWLQQKGTKATWRALVSACYQVKDQKLAEKIVDVCK